MRLALIAFALICSGCQSLKIDRHEALWQAANVLDTLQTLAIADYSNCYHESNVLSRILIGEYPDRTGVKIWGFMSGVSHYWVSGVAKEYKHKFGKWYRRLKDVDLSLKLVTVGVNHDMGLRVDGISQGAQESCYQ